jgi:hypothetical protein
MKTKQLELYQQDTDYILNVIKSKEAFGGFIVDTKYRNNNLRQRLKNIANKTRKLVRLGTYYQSLYYVNPYSEMCQDLSTLEYKKFCNKLNNTGKLPTEWTEEMFKTLIQKSKSTEII